MFRRVFVLIGVVVALLACEVQGAQISVSWDGGGDGHSWSDAYNWDPNIVPDNNASNSFFVTIDGSPNAVVIGFYLNREVNTLDCYNDVRLGKWAHDSRPELTVVEANGLTNYGELEISSSGLALQIVGNVTNYGEMEVECDFVGDVTNKTGGVLEYWDHLNIYGNLYNEAGATLLFGDEDLDVEGDGVGTSKIENDGVIICQHDHGGPGEEDVFYNRGSIQLFGGSCSAQEIFDNNEAGQIEGWGAIRAWGDSGNQVIQNKGSIYASAGTLLLWSNGSIINIGEIGNEPLASLRIKVVEDVNNQGTIAVNASGGVAFDCNLVNDSNGVIELLGGILSAPAIIHKESAIFNGFGGITTPHFLIDVDAVLRTAGPTNIVGDVTIDPNATFEISDGITLVTGHTTCNNGTIHMKGGRFIPQGGFTDNSCSVIWEPGLYNNVADFNLDGLVNFKDFDDFADTWLWQAQL